jgi:hypothetical protein
VFGFILLRKNYKCLHGNIKFFNQKYIRMDSMPLSGLPDDIFLNQKSKFW